MSSSCGWKAGYRLPGSVAAHGAGVATTPRGEDLFFVGFPLQFIHTFKCALAEVAGGQNAAGVERLYQAGRAAHLQIPTERVFFDHFVKFTANCHQRFGVVSQVLVALIAAHGDGAQVLAAHHRPQAVAPVEVTQFVGQPGKTDEFFTRRANLQHADFVIAQLGADGFLDFSGKLAPQVFGGSDFGLLAV